LTLGEGGFVDPTTAVSVVCHFNIPWHDGRQSGAGEYLLTR